MTANKLRTIVSNGVTTHEALPEKGTILILDDDKFLLDMYAMKFSQIGFRVHASPSAGEALKVLREGFSPDIILFDLIMPEGDGFSFLATVKGEHLAPNASAIALTNQMDAEEKKRIMDMGAAEYIVKATMIPSEVVAAVEERLAGKQ